MEEVRQFIHGIDWARWSAPALSAMRIVLIVVVATVAIVTLQKLGVLAGSLVSAVLGLTWGVAYAWRLRSLGSSHGPSPA